MILSTGGQPAEAIGQTGNGQRDTFFGRGSGAFDQDISTRHQSQSCKAGDAVSTARTIYISDADIDAADYCSEAVEGERGATLRVIDQCLGTVKVAGDDVNVHGGCPS
jgi:hypothetical protein